MYHSTILQRAKRSGGRTTVAWPASHPLGVSHRAIWPAHRTQCAGVTGAGREEGVASALWPFGQSTLRIVSQYLNWGFVGDSSVLAMREPADDTCCHNRYY